MKKTTLLLFIFIYFLNTIAMLRVVDKKYAQKLSSTQLHSLHRKILVPLVKKQEEAELSRKILIPVPKEIKKPEQLIAPALCTIHLKKTELLIEPTFCAILEQNIFTIPFLCARYERSEEIVSLVRALVCTNKFLKKFINDKKMTLQLIKQLRPHFLGHSDFYIVRLLGTKAVRDRFTVQKAFLEGWVDHHRCPFAEHSKILQKSGVDLEFTSGYEWETPLLKALWGQYPGIAIWLIDNGADITVCDPCKTNACMTALAIHWLPLTEKILNHPKFDVHYSDNAKNTPLHYCFFKFQENGIARYDQTAGKRYRMDEIIEKLLQKGADPTLMNCNGKTPLNFAKESGEKRIIDLMEKAAANLLINKETS